MRLGAMLVLVASVGCAPSVNFGGLRPGPRQAQFQDHIASGRLANGLRVAVLPEAQTNLVTVTVRYEVGASDDPADGAGLAHYVEHLIYEAPLHGGIVDVGLGGNAITGRDRTYFFAEALDTQLDAVLETAARRLEMTCDALAPDVLARERDVVIEEEKRRSGFGWAETLEPMVWGDGHPYARTIGGPAFASVSRERLCAFIDQHYGPASATLVISGHVDAGALARIEARFARIPARAIAPRPQLPALAGDVVRARVHGLKRPTAALVFRVPGEGSDSDAAIDMLQGVMWRLGRDAPNAYARTVVVGEERARAVIAYTYVDDPTQLAAAANALQETFADPRFGDLDGYKQQARNAFAANVESLVSSGIRVSDMAARGERLTRFRRLKAIDDLTPEDITRWITGKGDRVLLLEPDGSAPGVHDLAEVATGLHHLEIARPEEATDLTPPPAQAHRIAASIVEDHLPNGLTVWLAPDPAAISVAARVVMPFDVGQGAARDLAMQAAGFLQAHAVSGTADAETVRWYRSVGVPVEWTVRDRAVVFGVDGFALFGDWHVWNLAWTLVDGSYPPVLDVVAGTRQALEGREAPGAFDVLLRRLQGETAAHTLVVASRGQLEQFRQSHFDPSRATLIVAGNFDVLAMRREVSTLFGRWKSSGTPAAAPARVHAAPGFVAVPILHSLTLQIAIGFAGDATEPAEPAARAVLSELVNDRLRVIREGLGISYGVQGVVARDVILGGAVEPAYAAEAAHAMLDVIRRVREGDAAFAADFVRARKQVLATALAESSGASARANELERAAIDGGGVAQLDRRIEEIRTVSIEDVRRVAARDLRPEQMIVVVRGESDVIQTAMAAFEAADFDTVTR